MEIKAVIFDLDCTLVDSTESIWRNADAVMKSNGFRGISKGDVERRMGLTIFDLFLDAEPGLTEEQKRKLFEDYRDGYERFMRYTKILPYARESLELMRGRGAKLALVTTKSRMNASKVLRQFGLMEFFDVVCGFEDSAEHKPAPEPIVNALRRLGVGPSEALVIGDSDVDVKAAKGAGASVVAVATGVLSAERLRMEDPDAVIASLSELPGLVDGKR